VTNRSPTIRDVAERAGVSVTTVSHVYSGKRRVASETIERVLKVGADMGYHPHAAARTLASGRSTTIALEIELAGGNFLVNPYFSSVMSALSVAAIQNGFTFALLPNDPDEGEAVRAALRQHGVAGAIVVEPTISNRWIPALLEDAVRVVTIGRYPIDLETSWVDNDHRSGMREAMGHLADQGYRRIALLSVHERTSLVIDLESAFDQAVAELGLAGRTVFMGDLVESSARAITHQVLESRNPPDAIIGVIDRVAVGVMQGAAEVGVSVPDDLGIVGVGDTVLSKLSDPPITSIQSTPNELAHEAVRLLRAIWLDPEMPNSHVSLPAKLEVRASTMREKGKETGGAAG
jgi:DNA-binding LacI/PurR family transcriptional regulator